MERAFQDTFKERLSSTNEKTILNVLSRASGSLFYEITEASNVDLVIHVEHSANLKLFVLNRSNDDVDLNLTIHVDQDAICQMGLLDLQDGKLNWKQFVDLKKEGAQFSILSGQLCMPDTTKICSMEVCHEKGHTFGQMQNFAVLFDRAQYEMVANGNIKKGCAEAQSHQTTRVLTLGKDHSAKVIPLLLIDENEVKASHALSIGQPNEEQLYYLCSRGLSKQQAMGLLSVGYFLPVLDLIDDKELYESLRAYMESKVGLYGYQ